MCVQEDAKAESKAAMEAEQDEGIEVGRVRVYTLSS